jgi:hypothetical protein
MKPLPTKFTKNGFAHTQLRRQGRVAIYERRSLTHDAAPHYEVIIVRHADAHQWPNGATSEEMECYPSSESWGVSAWTCLDAEKASLRFCQECRLRSEGTELQTLSESGSIKVADTQSKRLKSPRRASSL